MAAPPAPPFIGAKHHGGHQDTIRRIVIHSTVSNTYCGGARAIARYFQNPSYVSSAHYVVDPCDVIQCVWDHTIAWHDGTNSNSIGVEMCEHPSQDVDRWNHGEHPAMLARTADLVRQLAEAYDIPLRTLTPAEIRAGSSGICGHNDMAAAFPANTSHWDPGAFPWHHFLALATGAVDSGGLESMALDTQWQDSYGNTQTVESFMADIQRKVNDVHYPLVAPGSLVSRIPGDNNTTNLRDAIMDSTSWQAQTLGMVAGYKATVDKLADLLASQQQLDADSIKQAVADALAEGTVNVDVTVTGGESGQ